MTRRVAGGYRVSEREQLPSALHQGACRFRSRGRIAAGLTAIYANTRHEVDDKATVQNRRHRIVSNCGGSPDGPCDTGAGGSSYDVGVELGQHRTRYWHRRTAPAEARVRKPTTVDNDGQKKS